jgi:hypothetical protein
MGLDTNMLAPYQLLVLLSHSYINEVGAFPELKEEGKSSVEDLASSYAFSLSIPWQGPSCT